MTQRTWLFVPATRPERFAKAAASGADEIICDLEDAVPVDGKDGARQDVAAWLSNGGSGWVRINGVGTDWFDDDVAVLTSAPGLRGVVLPKAEDPADLDALASRLRDGATRGLVALVETARGLMQAGALAASESVDRLAFGSIDYAADIDAEHDDEPLLLARSTLVLVSRCAHKPAPIDGVTADYRDLDAVHGDARSARRLGFGGKLCIHPAQLDAVATAFRPSADQVDWAREVLAAAQAADGAATSLHGKMIDKPVLDRAARILDSAL
jgi:citrate lyase subunit beta/citryl-CoA lyase